MAKKQTVSIQTPEERKALAVKTAAAIAAKKAENDAKAAILAEQAAQGGTDEAAEVKPASKPVKATKTEKPVTVKEEKKEPAKKTEEKKEAAPKVNQSEEFAAIVLKSVVKAELMPFKSDMEKYFLANPSGELFCVIHSGRAAGNAQAFRVERAFSKNGPCAGEYDFTWIKEGTHGDAPGSKRVFFKHQFDVERSKYYYESRAGQKHMNANFFQIKA